MKIILVSGIPASGKTTIAKSIGDKLELPLHTKDQEKEKLFSSETKSTYLRWGWYEKRANDMLFTQLKECIQDNQDVILESNFIPAKDKKHIVATDH